MASARLEDYVGGKWVASLSKSAQDVRNPATGEVIGSVPLGTAADVDRAASAAHQVFSAWRETPAVQRARYLFELKYLLEKNAEELARTVTARRSTKRAAACAAASSASRSRPAHRRC